MNTGLTRLVSVAVGSVLAGLFLSGASAPSAEAAAKSSGFFQASPATGESKSGSVDEPSPAEMQIENSVVRVFATVQPPDLGKPWSKRAGMEVTGSGVVIDGRRILTNAHVVLYAEQIQIQGHQSGDKISATVDSVAPGVDLAVLKLSDESFFSTHAALPLATELPRVKDPVMVYGFPTGGTSISITKGIVSRIDFAAYNYPATGLRVQIDAAINPGNSGGPAVVGSRLAGVAFSILPNSQNIGYIIPCEEIDLFLKDVADGRYDGKPAIFDDFQTFENPALRAFLKLDESVKGIVVQSPYQSDTAYPLKKWDLITRIGDIPIDDQGNIMRENDLKLPFASLVQKIADKGKVPMTIMRTGKELAIQLPVSSARPKLIPYLQGTYPPYFIFGPMVFSIAVEEMIASIAGAKNGVALMNMLSTTGNPLITRRSDQPAFEGEELVIVPSPFFPHPLAKNYSPPVMRILSSVNGIPVKNLRHMVEIIRDSKDEFVRFEFSGRGTELLVFPRAPMIAATEEILNNNGIRSLGSSDILEVWNQKRP